MRRCEDVNKCRLPDEGELVRPQESFEFKLYYDEDRTYIVANAHGRTFGCLTMPLAAGVGRYPDSLSDLMQCPPGNTGGVVAEQRPTDRARAERRVAAPLFGNDARAASSISRMSYDLFLMRFDAGAPAQIDSPEFWELLARAWQKPPDDHGFVRLVRGDGEADVYAGRLGEALESVMVNHFGGDEIMDLIVELARQADAVIIGPDLPPLLTRTEQRDQLPPDMDLGEPVLIASGHELSQTIAQD
jgi:hypothetical protein